MYNIRKHAEELVDSMGLLYTPEERERLIKEVIEDLKSGCLD